MANNYYGVPGSVGYNPYMQSPIGYSQPISQSNDFIFVLDENAARSYPVANGQKVILWDRDNPTYYVKSVDINGIPTFRIFDFTERISQPAIDSSKNVTDEYVTKADFDAFANKILDKLNERQNYHKKPQNKEV